MNEISIVTYNNNWPSIFEEEKALLSSLLSIESNAIHHIGSTSVPNLSAKPVIDILIEVNKIQWLDQFNIVFELNKYECMGEFGITGRRYYRKGKEKRTHQIHAFEKQSHAAIRHIAFKEYLKNFPLIAEEYSKLKTLVAKQCLGDMQKYCDGKDSFIKEHEAEAVSWYNRA